MVAAPKTVELAGNPEPPKTRDRSFHLNFTWVLAGNAVYLACQWLVLAVVAKAGSQEMVGQLSMGFAITAPIFLLSNLRLRTVQATDAGREYEPSDYLGVRILATVLALAATGLVCLVYPMTRQVAAVVMCVALAKAFESGSDLFYGLFQQNDFTSRMTVSILVRGICSVTAVATAIYLGGNALSAAAALCISSAFLLMACDLPLTLNVLRRIGDSGPRLRWHWLTIRRLSRASFPLGLSAMLMSLGANMPRYFIERSLGVKQVGFFSAVWYVATVGGYLVSALAEGASPRLGRLHGKGDAFALRKLLATLVGLACVISAATLAINGAAGSQILTFIYNPSYRSGAALLIWLSVAAAAANFASIFSYALISVRRYRDHLIALILMTAITAAACPLLISIIGQNGAALALAIGYVAQAGWGLWALRNERCSG